MSENFILIGILLFILVFLPVLLIRDYRQKRKVRQILEAHRQRNEQDSQGPDSGQTEREGDLDGAPEGWGMNNSPFRKRKSGLSWGGGNIKASEATRGERRKFLR